MRLGSCTRRSQLCLLTCRCVGYGCRAWYRCVCDVDVSARRPVLGAACRGLRCFAACRLAGDRCVRTSDRPGRGGARAHREDMRRRGPPSDPVPWLRRLVGDVASGILSLKHSTTGCLWRHLLCFGSKDDLLDENMIWGGVLCLECQSFHVIIECRGRAI